MNLRRSGFLLALMRRVRYEERMHGQMPHSQSDAAAARSSRESSSIGVNQHVVLALGNFARVANVILFIIPCLVFVGWTFGIEVLKRVVPGLVEMNPFSAVNFILLGMALAEARHLSRVTPVRVIACLFVISFGLLIEWNYLVGLGTPQDTHIDQKLFPGSIGTNRMAPNTAANFIFISLALLLVDVRTRRDRRPAQMLALLTAIVALLALIGYGYQVGKLYGVGTFIPMALHVAFCFLLLALAVLCVRSEAGIMARLSSNGPGGTMVRRLLFWLVAVPLLVGWLILAGHRAAAFDAAFGFTLFVVLVIVFVSLMIWKNATSLDRKEAERNRAEESLRRARDELEVRVHERVGDLVKVTVEVRDAVHLLTQAGGEIVSSSSALAASAAETATAVAETTTTVEELRRTSELSSENAHAVAESARETAQTSERGRQAASAAERAMERIREHMEALAERTAQLGQQTQSIAEIIATVDDLAQRSNVLAINAAIEAVKAGEQGRGFSVVAKEVRALAAQSQKATTQVRAILKEISKANLDAMNATKDGRASVEAGVSEFARAGESIAQLTGAVSKNAQAATQISASSQQQSTGMDQVAEAVRSVKSASERNVETARQLEAAAQNLNALGQRLRDLVTRYQQQTSGSPQQSA